MTQPEQEAREMLALLPCPFCGRPAKVCPDTSYGAATVYCPDENLCGVQPVADAELKDGETLEDAIRRWNQRAFAARPTAGIDREVAYEAAFRAMYGPDMDPFQHPEGQDYASSVADAILALLPTPAKTGERGAVIEECARVVDLMAARAKAIAEKRFADAGPIIEVDHAMAAHLAYEAAAQSIRALSQPLPDAPIVGGEG